MCTCAFAVHHAAGVREVWAKTVADDDAPVAIHENVPGFPEEAIAEVLAENNHHPRHAMHPPP